MQLTNRSKPVLLTQDQEAIVALCTPRGSGAIALIRVSGVNAVAAVDLIAQLSSGSTLEQALSHTIHHGQVVDADGVVDEVLFLLMREPKTFTGQDTVEITCHNNPFIIERVIAAVCRSGARLACSGEFTKRSFLNGKVDLVQAEAINDLIHAQSQRALRCSMEQLSGSLSQHISDIERQLVILMGYVEASFDFLDEEQRDLDFDQVIRLQTTALLDRINTLKSQFSLQQNIKQGVRVAIVGLVNAGKSTLFNALVNQERAIVTDQAGTTRDSIETSLFRKGNFWLYVDTAGLRQTTDFIEKQGIERSLAQAACADIIVLVVDATRSLTVQQQSEYEALARQYHEKVIVAVNKIDQTTTYPLLTGMEGLPVVYVSAKTREGVVGLEETIEEKIQYLFAQLNSPFLLNQRQFNLLTEIEQKLRFIANSYSDGIHYEMIACHLKDLLEKVSELTGKNVSERVLDMIFNEFCVGK